MHATGLKTLTKQHRSWVKNTMQWLTVESSAAMWWSCNGRWWHDVVCTHNMSHSHAWHTTAYISTDNWSQRQHLLSYRLLQSTTSLTMLSLHCLTTANSVQFWNCRQTLQKLSPHNTDRPVTTDWLTILQVCVQLPTYNDNVDLLLNPVLLWRRTWSNRSIPPTCWAHSSKPATCCCSRRLGQTDGHRTVP